MTTRFVVELPADKQGNTALLKAVYEVQEIPGRPRTVLRIIGPAEQVSRGYKSMGNYPVKDVPGPARMLSFDEWAALAGWKEEQ